MHCSTFCAPICCRISVVFQQMMEPNAHLIRSMRHIRTRIPEENWHDEGLSAINDAVDTEWGQQTLHKDPRILEWRSRLMRKPELDNEERIRCLRDLEDLQTFAHVMNRTRRRDIGKFTIREPHTEEVAFTPEQMTFYKALIHFREKMLSLGHDARTVRLITVGTERQVSSCLPALLPMLDSFIKFGRFSSADFTDDLEDEFTLDLHPSLVESAKELRYLATNLPPEDPKLDRLKELIGSVLEDSRSKKVLVFSFFLHTLTYLKTNLANSSARVGIITGQTDDDERERLRQRFRLSHDDPKAQLISCFRPKWVVKAWIMSSAIAW